MGCNVRFYEQANKSWAGAQAVWIEVVCFYGSLDGPPGALDVETHQLGPPCSKCPQRKGCKSKKFKNLCGEHEPLASVKYRWNETYWSIHGMYIC